MESTTLHVRPATPPHTPPRERNAIALAALAGVLTGIASGAWLAFDFAGKAANFAAGERTVDAYTFGEENATSLDGRYVATRANFIVNGSRKMVCAISRTGADPAWYVPYSWKDLSVRDIGWLDEQTVQISAYERHPGAARERILIEDLGVTVVCRVLDPVKGAPR